MSNPWQDAEAWQSGGILGPGLHVVEIAEVDDDGGTMVSSNGNPQFVVRFENDEGSIKEWVTVTPATLGKIVPLFESAGVGRPNDDDFDSATLRPGPSYLGRLLGKRVMIFVGEEPSRDDPTKMRSRVSGYKEATGNVPTHSGRSSYGPSDVPADSPAQVVGNAAAPRPKDNIPF